MLRLLADPWLPEYGMGFDAPLDVEVDGALVDPSVETDDWREPLACVPATDVVLHFVDGIRRVEVRLIADDGTRSAAGLFSTFAVGAVRCDSMAAFSSYRVRRHLILGAGLPGETVSINVGASAVTYAPATIAGTAPEDPLLRLQELMRIEEARLAEQLASADEQTLVVADGPLAYLRESVAPIIGLVKRFGRTYLEGKQQALVPRLEPRQRTPLFSITSVGGRVRRYAWYTRVAHTDGPWHALAGVVRCEVLDAAGLSAARGIADRVSGALPRFAGRATDPRTPQNVLPIAALESWLRHRAGDTTLVRHALLAHLAEAA